MKIQRDCIVYSIHFFFLFAKPQGSIKDYILPTAHFIILEQILIGRSLTKSKPRANPVVLHSLMYFMCRLLKQHRLNLCRGTALKDGITQLPSVLPVSLYEFCRKAESKLFHMNSQFRSFHYYKPKDFCCRRDTGDAVEGHVPSELPVAQK